MLIIVFSNNIDIVKKNTCKFDVTLCAKPNELYEKVTNHTCKAATAYSGYRKFNWLPL